jgi:hypothetical protein
MRLHFASVRSSAPTGDHITGDDAAAAAGVVAATLRWDGAAADLAAEKIEVLSFSLAASP